MSSQYNTPPVSQFPNLQYTPSSGDSQAYSTPDSSTPNTGDLVTPTDPNSRKEVLAQSLAKLQEVVDSLHTDSWMFEVPRHTYH
ncbi:hypothetical protein OEZ85_007124 [Tetradesmus obliquus]|uniref:Uncharacterized protein n=1 Tax=Tetradesmus obliquus TaxID=3088 RepID=A0ABY8TWQ6_TETOB|nr:hypothetical protein OEZ85_007124 [Tetradesmus obliquus]